MQSERTCGLIGKSTFVRRTSPSSGMRKRCGRGTRRTTRRLLAPSRSSTSYSLRSSQTKASGSPKAPPKQGNMRCRPHAWGARAHDDFKTHQRNPRTQARKKGRCLPGECMGKQADIMRPRARLGCLVTCPEVPILQKLWLTLALQMALTSRTFSLRRSDPAAAAAHSFDAAQTQTCLRSSP